MNYSQMKDELLLLYYEAVRQEVILDGNSHYRYAGNGVRAYADKLREEINGDGFVSRLLIGQAHDGRQVRSPY